MTKVHRVIATVLSFVAAIVCALLLSPPSAHAQEATPLEAGKSIEREITGGQSHRYQITLAAGAYLHVEAVERGVNVTLVLRGPDGAQLAEMNAAGTTFLEELSWEAESGGAYALEVRVGNTNKGQYEVKAQIASAAGVKERTRIAAELLYMEAVRAQAEAGGTGRERAIRKYEEALLKWRESGDRKWEGRTLYSLGSIFLALQQFDRMEECFQQTLTIARELKDKQTEHESLFRIAIANQELSRYEQSIPYFEQALQLRRELKDRAGEGRAIMFLGGSYSYLSQHDKAREYFEQALVITREVNDRRSERGALGGIAGGYAEQSQYDKALAYFEQVLVLSRTDKDKFKEAETLNNIGEINMDLGQYEKALAHAEQALALNREIRNRQREGFSLQTIGTAHFFLRQYEKAIASLEPALALYRDVKTKYGEGMVLTLLGEVHLTLRQYEQARTYNEQALKIAREAQIGLTEGRALLNLGNVALALQQNLPARSYYEQALLVQRRIKSKYDEGTTLSNLMAFWKTSARPGLAVFFGKRAVNVYQEIRSSIQGLAQETQQSFLKSKEDTYRQLADLLIAQGRLPEAEQVIRMLKEEEYFDYIRRDKANLPQAEKAALTPEEAELEKRYREIADKLTEIGTERGALLEKKSRTLEEEQRLAKLEADLTIAGQMFQKFLDGLANELGKNAEASNRVFQLRESQGMMEALRDLGKGTVALYTLVGEDQFRVILTTADVQKGFAYPIKAADLNRKILAFRDVLQNPKLDPLPLAQELYKILIAPLAKDLKAAKAETLMWSLDGVLRYVPMAALHDGDKYLVERWRNVVFTPASQTRLKDDVSRNWKALGLGVTKAHGLTIPALPGVLEEMRGIIKADGATSGVLPGTIKLDEQFTQEAMLTGLRQRPPVVHVASHFQFKPGNETDSALLLGDGKFLSLAQIKALPNVFSGVELLTLSACNTATGGSGATGKEVEGFGVLAQRQGAKAVIASLWPVADRSTKNLMQEFYKLREAKANTTKAEAMRQAQIKLLRGELQVTGEALAARDITHETDKTVNQPRFKVDPKAPYAHPYYWAPFILIGNWK